MKDELEKDEDGKFICRFNEECHCDSLDCVRCGWNPVVAKMRTEQWLKKMGCKEA